MSIFQKENSIDKLSIAALRSLVIDETNKAKSGHPGMGLDAAPIIYVLFKNELTCDPAHPKWINRDRFVLSAGHASALLYALLHVTGYPLSMDDLKKFRQFDSLTPGHPEYGHTIGVDATAGPLGQGICQAVGMAIAEEAVAASYPDGNKVMNHYTYCLCGDGCLEEGLSQEAISLAGHQRLKKLILFYDENGSTLDGPTSNSLSEDVRLRFLASEWNVEEVKDGNDVDAIAKALGKAKKSKMFPTLIIVHTIIGYGSEKQGTSKVHGTPLGAEDGAHAKKFYGYDYPDFTVPSEVYDLFKNTFAKRGAAAYAQWLRDFADFKRFHPADSKRFEDAFQRNVEPYLPATPAFDAATNEATRATSGKIVASLPSKMPFVIGGSADVAASVMTAIPGDPSFTPEHREAHNINFGIREFAMAGIQNGILLHGGLVTYAGCFLIFSDYMKNAIRMSALEKIPAIYLFSHDSVAVGEDGPTHEPIEQLSSLRLIPGLAVYRPADARETYAAWRLALLSHSVPSALVLTRQGLPLLPGSSEEGVKKGAYLISPALGESVIQLLASGSEVPLAVSVQKLLLAQGVAAEVVSMPSWERFEAQNEEYKAQVLHLPKSQRYSLEMGSGALWYKYADHVFSIETYGKSAPASEVIAYFGFTPDKIAGEILESLK
jgi:transketolase